MEEKRREKKEETSGIVYIKKTRWKNMDLCIEKGLNIIGRCGRVWLMTVERGDRV